MYNRRLLAMKCADLIDCNSKIKNLLFCNQDQIANQDVM